MSNELMLKFVLPVILLVIVLFSVMMAFRPSVVQSIEAHDMGGGVTCYTFNTSIDCLRIGE